MNEEKGGIAKKNCAVACTGCEKCIEECKYDSIVIENSLAYIDGEKCKLCRKCVDVCKTSSILEINFAPKKDRPPKDRPNRKLARTKSEDEGVATIASEKLSNNPLQTPPEAGSDTSNENDKSE